MKNFISVKDVADIQSLVNRALDYKSKATKLEATYRQNGRDFRLKFDAEGKSGRFKLEFNF